MSRMSESSKTRRPRRQFDEEFQTQAVRLGLDDGKTVGTVARDLDLPPSALRLWVTGRSHPRPGELLPQSSPSDVRNRVEPSLQFTCLRRQPESIVKSWDPAVH